MTRLRKHVKTYANNPKHGAPVALFVLALLARVIYLLQYRSSPFFEFPIIDSATYDRMAWDYAQGRPLWKGAFWQPPLYPWFLGLLYNILGHSLFGVRVIQALLSSVSCILLYGIGRNVFSRRVGIMAGAIMAVNGTLIYFDGELLPASLYVFLLLCGLVALLHASSTKVNEWMWRLAAGLILGLAALTRSDVMLFLCLGAAWAWSMARGRWHERLASPAFLVVGAAIAVLPVTVRNYYASDDVVLVSSNGGLNFYLGNNPKADSTVAIRPGFAWESLVNEPFLKGGIEKPSARSRYFFQKGWVFLLENPRAGARLYLEKAARFWNSLEIGRNRDVYSTRGNSRLLSILLWRVGPFGFPFGLLVPLACVGVMTCVPLSRGAVLLVVFVASYMVVVVAFFVASRYRLPILPIMGIFAAQYVSWLARQLSHRRLRPAILSVALFALVAVGVSPGLPAIVESYGGEEDRYLGVYYVDRGRYKEAEAAYRRALAVTPDYPEAHSELGQLLLVQARSREALYHLKRANELCGFSERTHYLLGIGLRASGDSVEAERVFRKAISIAPYGPAHRELGVLLLEQGRIAEAEGLLLEAVRCDPSDLDAWYKLGQCYFLLGSYGKAEDALQGALRLAPGDAEIREKIRSLQILRGSSGSRVGDL